jgi:hypothetical protein
MTDATTDTPTDTAEAPEAPNPIDVILAAIKSVPQGPHSAGSTALRVFNALLDAPVATRHQMATALLNTATDDDDTVILVMKRPEAFAMDAAQNWWPMQPAPGIAEMVQAAAAREAAFQAKEPALAKGTFVTPAPPPAVERKLRLV